MAGTLAGARGRPAGGEEAKGRPRVGDEKGEELGDELRRRRPLGLGFEAAGSTPSLHVYGGWLQGRRR